MRSYAKMLEDKEEEKLKVIYHLGLYESILIRGNMTIEICEEYNKRYTSRYDRDSKVGFLTKTEYWL